MPAESSIEPANGSFDRLYARVHAEMLKHGRDFDLDANAGDFWVIQDDWGSGQLLLYIMNLELLRPEIIHRLRTIVRRYRGWEIIVAIDVIGKEGIWPDMGLKIRHHEILDSLQRDYFPPEFRGYQYEGARIGTVRD